MNDAITTLEGRIDKGVTGEMAIGTTGAVTYENASQMMEAAKMMAVSGVAVPKHLRGQPGACLAVIMQSSEWRMSAFAVANKSYSVSDRLAYEAQLVQAVINQRAPIKGRLKGSYEGEGVTRQCIISAVDEESGETLTYTSPMLKDIGVKNSPLWKNDPDQQLWYYSARAFARRHYPDVLLGVYEREEMRAGNIGPDNAINLNPSQSLREKMEAKAKAQAAVVEDINGADDVRPEDPAQGETIEDAEILPDDDDPGSMELVQKIEALIDEAENELAVVEIMKKDFLDEIATLSDPLHRRLQEHAKARRGDLK